MRHGVIQELKGYPEDASSSTPPPAHQQQRGVSQVRGEMRSREGEGESWIVLQTVHYVVR